MEFEKSDFKKLYVSKYGENLDWEKLNEFAQYICKEQKNNIIEKDKNNRPYLGSNTVDSEGYQDELDDDEQNIF